MPNIALKKIELYHKLKGDEIIWDMPMFSHWADKIYVSCVFDFNRYLCKEWEGLAEIGGSGFSITKKLPKKIDKLMPKINYGFTTRGCIRSCHFCIVPQKEGKIIAVGDIYDFWDGKSKELVILDNNILAMPKHFKKICGQIRKEKLKVDFNQGLDLRLLYKNTELLNELKTLKRIHYKFAWDLDDNKMIEKLQWLIDNLCSCVIFILAGFDSYENIIIKLDILKKMGHRPYIMRHESVRREKRYILLAQWVNQHHMFMKTTIEEFMELQKTKNKK